MLLGSQMMCDLHLPDLGSSPWLESNISIQWRKEIGRAGLAGGKGLEWKERGRQKRKRREQKELRETRNSKPSFWSQLWECKVARSCNK